MDPYQTSRAAADHYARNTQPARYARRSGTLGGLLGGIGKASTVQKVVGGALLAFGVGLLLSRKAKTLGTATPSAPAEALHELLLFVNDRVAGYERAVEHSQDAELRGYYKQLVSQSQQFAGQLNTYLTQAGSERETSTTVKGKLYRAFMDAGATLTGHDDAAILAANIHGETWAFKAYTEALADPTLTGAARLEVARQHGLSQETLKRLEKLAEKAE
ncbi:PA2169 family four-helix-bundle protein [Hymenobacter sp. ASUV-10]|uniref:PA2169 family four-helix-bundle protein n=1 Tax=Hymenobacter aranciens TaxID=3063996 RepID=A0ABT9BEN2_9BACT|nr:PA2169 family four-helix-bundle protein [Hymenobacter sp. ASUV-10]MDO7876692.1 PA2169 family four-helix-bundle protein [Hymenobacter sp. ASUV-10]